MIETADGKRTEKRLTGKERALRGITLILFLTLFIAIAFVSCDSKPTAKQVIGKSYKKCQSIILNTYKN